MWEKKQKTKNKAKPKCSVRNVRTSDDVEIVSVRIFSTSYVSTADVCESCRGALHRYKRTRKTFDHVDHVSLDFNVLELST